MRARRGQGTVEFMLNYGWMIIIALVIMAAFYKYGIFSDKFHSVHGFAVFDSPGFAITDYRASNTLNTQGANVIFLFVNNRGTDITISQGDITLYDQPGIPCTPLIEGGQAQSATDIIIRNSNQASWMWKCDTPLGMEKRTKWQTTFEMNYDLLSESVEHSIHGTLKAVIE